MKTPLRVLLVAASRGDAEPLLEELARAGYEVTWELVRNRSEMEQAVSESWDVVLSEYEFPGFGALPALEEASAVGLDVPFLVIFDGEDSEVRILRAGADSCLPRAAMARLAPEIERKLSAARLRRERRMARQTLQESESRFRALAESASDVFLTTDPDGLLLFVNRAVERVFGHAVAAVIGRSIERLLPGLLPLPAGRGSAVGESVPVEGQGLHASGRKIPIELSVATFQRGGKRLLTVVARDITDRKRAEEALQSSKVLKRRHRSGAGRDHHDRRARASPRVQPGGREDVRLFPGRRRRTAHGGADRAPSARERHRQGSPARIVHATNSLEPRPVFATTLIHIAGRGCHGYWSEVRNFGFLGTDTTNVELH